MDPLIYVAAAGATAALPLIARSRHVQRELRKLDSLGQEPEEIVTSPPVAERARPRPRRSTKR